MGFCNFTYVIVVVYFITFESLIMYRDTRKIYYVSKGLIAAAFKSSEPLPLLRLNRCVGAIPT